jgi:phospholipase C
LDHFENATYNVSVYGPNGFFREFIGDSNDPSLEVTCDYTKSNEKKQLPRLELKVKNSGSKAIDVQIVDLAYGQAGQNQQLQPGDEKTISFDLTTNHGWYDHAVNVLGNNVFKRRLSGRVETGELGYTDPAMA